MSMLKVCCVCGSLLMGGLGAGQLAECCGLVRCDSDRRCGQESCVEESCMKSASVEAAFCQEEGTGRCRQGRHGRGGRCGGRRSCR